MGSTEKIKLTFLSQLFKTSYLQNIFLHAVSVLSYLAILKSGLGLAFGAHFLLIFFPGLTLSIDKVI